jgi:hypothetical protein
MVQVGSQNIERCFKKKVSFHMQLVAKFANLATSQNG